MSFSYTPSTERSGSRRSGGPDWWNPIGEPEFEAKGDSFLGRAFSGLVRLPDTLMRGIFNLGRMAVQDASRAVHEGVGALPGVDEYGALERARDRGWNLPEVGSLGLESFQRTGTALADLTLVPRLIEGAIEEDNVADTLEYVRDRFATQLRDFDADPVMYTVEHLGNVAITGSAVSRPAQLARAASRGQITGSQALRGLRPIAGREARETARIFGAEAAAQTPGMNIDRALGITGDIIGHPYRSAGRAIRQSAPVQHLRSPLTRTEATARFQNRDAARAAGEHTVGPLDMLANELGLGLERLRDTPIYQDTLSQPVRLARQIRSDLQRSSRFGAGDIFERARQEVPNLRGTINMRRTMDPVMIERTLRRNIDNLKNRPDADRFRNLIRDLESMPSPTDGSLARRAGQVVTGGRVIGGTLTPDQLGARISRIIDEARIQTAGSNDPLAMSKALRDIMPDIDPIGLYITGLDASDLRLGLPQGTLQRALTDYVTMDQVADLSRRAQRELRQAKGGQSATPERFRIEDAGLDVDINKLPQDIQDIFYGAAEQWRAEQGFIREPALIQEGLIPQGGSRAGLHPSEPTQFPTSAYDLPLTSDHRRRLTDATEDYLAQQEVVAGIEERISQLEQTAGQTRVYDEIPFEGTKGNPAQAVRDKLWQTRTSQESLKKWREKLNEEKAHLDTASELLDEVERLAFIDPANAPASARNLLVYGNEVAPRQAQALRSMADQGLGDAQTLRALADELDAVPKTLDDLNSMEVYVAYLRDVKRRNIDGTVYNPGSDRAIDTRQPPGTRRRQVEGTTDIHFERDFRTRAYWQESEFQRYFLSRQADRWVTNSGLAKTGRQRLLDDGYTEAEIKALSANQAQQILEELGLKSYHPDQLFGTSRKPPPGVSPLDGEWIAPHIDDILAKTFQRPPKWERRLGEGIWDPIHNAWRTTVLPLRFAWQVNNYFGNAFLTMMEGKVSPLDYPSLARASQKAVTNWKRGILDQIDIPINGSYRAQLQAQLQKLPPGSDEASRIRGMLEEGVIKIDNSTLNDIASGGLVRGHYADFKDSQFLRSVGETSDNIFRQAGIEIPELHPRTRRMRKSIREVVDYAYNVNETVDNFHRAMIYMDQIGKGYTHSQAIAQVNKALGDYSKLSQIERRLVRRVYPFYSWMQHIAKVVAGSFSPTNIQRTIVTSHMLSAMGQPNEWEELLPDWAGGHIFVGTAPDGTPRFLSSRGINPFLDVFDPISQPHGSGLLRPASPLIQFGIERLTGVDTLRNAPFTSPTGEPGARPPASEYVFRNIPWAGAIRDVYRDFMGEPLTRYGTGEGIYRTRINENRTGLQSITRMFGANIQTLDVESMRHRELQDEYRRELSQRRYDAEREAYGGRSARDLLEDLPLIGN